MFGLSWLAAKFLGLLILLGIVEGRRKCCGCGESEKVVGHLLGCRRILDKRMLYRDSKTGVVHCTFSRSSWVLPRVCQGCDRHIEKLQHAMVSLEVRMRLIDEKIMAMFIAEAKTGYSLRAVPVPELSLIPPLPDGIPVGGLPGM